MGLFFASQLINEWTTVFQIDEKTIFLKECVRNLYKNIDLFDWGGGAFCGPEIQTIEISHLWSLLDVVGNLRFGMFY